MKDHKTINEEKSAAIFSYWLNKVEQKKNERYQSGDPDKDELYEYPTSASTQGKDGKGLDKNVLLEDFKRHDQYDQKEVRKIISNMRYLDRVSSSRLLTKLSE
jgi:hypothetical protein